MSDRALIPLPDGRWLALAPEVFREAQEAGARVIAAPGSAAPVPVTDSEPLLDAGELARAQTVRGMQRRLLALQVLR